MLSLRWPCLAVVLAAGCSLVGGIDGEYELFPDKQPLWVEAFIPSDGDGDSSIAAMAATPDGGVVVVGKFRGTLNSGDHTLHANDSFAYCDDDTCSDGFVVKLGPKGGVQWSAGAQSYEHDSGVAVAVDADDTIVVGYQCSGEFNPWKPDLTFPGEIDICVARYGSEGTLIQVESFGGPGDDLLHALVVYDWNIFIGGQTAGMTLGDEMIGEQAFVARLSYGLEVNWARGDGDGDSSVMAMAAAENDLIIAGPGTAQSFVARIDQKGKLLAHQVFGSSTAAEELSSIARSPNGDLFAAGRLQGQADLFGHRFRSGDFASFVVNLGAL